MAEIWNEPLGDQVARALRREIFSGERSAGEMLIEKTLSEAYGLSRGPVRDAFKQLKQEGLIVQTGRSYRVCPVQAEDVREFVDLRLALEALAIERAIKRGGDWRNAHAALRGMRAATLASDLESFAQFDVVFHRALVEAAPQRRIVETYATLGRTIEIMLDLNPGLVADGTTALLEEHEALLAAIESGDESWRRLLREHFESGLDQLLGRFGGYWTSSRA